MDVWTIIKTFQFFSWKERKENVWNYYNFNKNIREFFPFINLGVCVGGDST